VSVIGLIAALAVLCVIVYMLFFKKYTEATKLTAEVKIK
jgi:ferrous iron transport protein B